jgi:hypothetical protein
MKRPFITMLSFVAAVAAPALIMIGWYTYGTFALPGAAGDPFAWVRIRAVAAPVLLVSAAHVVILGAPAFLLLRYLKRINWLSTCIAGFILGCIPIGVFAWPLRYASPGSSSAHWSGGHMVQTMVNGAPTFAGWLSWARLVGFFGVLGACGGLAFWLVWRTHANNSIQRTRYAGR